MDTAEIERMIKEAIPGAQVQARTDDGHHYNASVIAEQFRGLSRVQQHQMVYKALKEKIGGELHALALQTNAPE